MTKYETGAVRDTGGKGRCDLLPTCALIRISKHMEDALTHYPERNWENGLPMHSMIDSAMRHLFKYVDGMADEDHLCAAATNLLMAMWMEEKRPDLQDIPTRATERAKEDALDSRAADDTSESAEAKKGHTGMCRYAGVERRNGDVHCLGTKEMGPCPCGGDWRRCPHGKPGQAA